MAESRGSTKVAKCRYYCRVFLTHLFSHVGLCGLVVGYAIVGALTFESLEAPKERIQRTTIQGFRNNCLDQLWNITETFNVLYKENWTTEVRAKLREFEQHVVGAVKNDGYDGKDLDDKELQWSFSGALLYCITVITTIGYGNIAPKTEVGKVVTIFYAVLGIPLMLLFLTNIGDFLARSFKFTYSHFCALFNNPRRQRQQHIAEHKTLDKVAEASSIDIVINDEKKSISVDSSPTSSPSTKSAIANNNTPTPTNNSVVIHESNPVVIERVYSVREGAGADDEDRVPMYMVLLLVAGYICGGAVLFSLWEKWSFLDGAYFCFITLSTIGFGDLVPGSDILDPQGGQAKLIICCIYLILGLAIIAMSFNLVQEEAIIKFKNLGRNLGFLTSDTEDDDD